jgi:hypothetical protein
MEMKFSHDLFPCWGELTPLGAQMNRDPVNRHADQTPVTYLSE